MRHDKDDVYNNLHYYYLLSFLAGCHPIVSIPVNYMASPRHNCVRTTP